MTFAVILVVTAAAALALRNPIKKWPMLFYALAVIVDVLFVVGSFVALPRSLWSGLFLLVQKCTLSLALFVVVMYIGVFARDSKVKRWLRPIRAELFHHRVDPVSGAYGGVPRVVSAAHGGRRPNA